VAGFELGIVDYITKPFNFSEVLARIKVALRYSEARARVDKTPHEWDDLKKNEQTNQDDN
jgi:DNA-binding response OmpR family regulator